MVMLTINISKFTIKKSTIFHSNISYNLLFKCTITYEGLALVFALINCIWKTVSLSLTQASRLTPTCWVGWRGEQKETALTPLQSGPNGDTVGQHSPAVFCSVPLSNLTKSALTLSSLALHNNQSPNFLSSTSILSFLSLRVCHPTSIPFSSFSLISVFVCFLFHSTLILLSLSFVFISPSSVSVSTPFLSCSSYIVFFSSFTTSSSR